MLDSVKEYYGKILQRTEDLKTNACCTMGAPPKHLKQALSKVHDEVLAKYYGCGFVDLDALEECNILDLGSGSGRDCFVLAQWVGEQGRVVGVDMTKEQLDVAWRHEDWHREKFGFQVSNTKFLEGYIERLDELDLADNSFDIITSNCVINLSPDKPAVLKQAFRLLKIGGMLEFSDVYADRRIPQALREDPVLWGECLSGALYWADFEEIAKECGFKDVRIVKDSRITIENKALEEKIGHIAFYSVTYRLTKLPDGKLDAREEDFGQAVKYKGSIANNPYSWDLGMHCSFFREKMTPVSRNSFNILKYSRFAKHFDFFGDESTHFGPFSSSNARIVPFLSATSKGKDLPTTPVGGCC